MHTNAWPTGFDPDATFFLSGQSWIEVLNTEPQGGNGYYILAHQYIAAALNQAKGACTPEGIFDTSGTFELATAWLESNTQGTPKIGTGRDAIPATGCYVSGSCGLQITWGGILDEYNNGTYPGGPAHCDE
jgi:hypothetical protein